MSELFLSRGLCKKTIKEKNCVRQIRFSTSKETKAENDDSIIVYVRLKPLTQPNQEKLYEYTSTNIKYSEKDKRGFEKQMDFSFHRVFSPQVEQQHIFKTTVDESVDHFIAGENRLLFAYGTTSSGKTYTMFGNNSNPGIFPRCIVKVFLTLQNVICETDLCPDQGADIRTLSEEDLRIMNENKDLITCIVEDCEGKIPKEKFDFNFDDSDVMNVLDTLCTDIDKASLSKVEPEATYSVWVSFAEVYNENIYDLFSVQKERKCLKIGLDSKKDNYVKGLSHIQVCSWLELWQLFLYGSSRLHTNETQLNKNSSRSHSIFTLKLIKNVNKKYSISSLSVCDLAGTERQKKAQNIGESLFESRNINTSLMTLNRCFAAVRENKVSNLKKKPPYRDSKLTMIFQKAFSYGEPITMFVTMSQSIELFEETKYVLKMSAVAQEMVKPLPKLKDRFLKPNSRFSIICSNPNLKILEDENNISGVTNLSDTVNRDTANVAMINSYESKINMLVETIKKKDENIMLLLADVEDAKVEYLNLVEKMKETETKLTEEEKLCDDYLKDLEMAEIVMAFRIKKYKMLEEQHEQALERIEELKKKNEDLNEIIKGQELKLKEKEQIPVPNRRGRALLSNIVHLENLSPNLSDLSLQMNPEANSTLINGVNNQKTPRSTRKKKMNLH